MFQTLTYPDLATYLFGYEQPCINNVTIEVEAKNLIGYSKGLISGY